MKDYSPEQLQKMNKELLITLVISLQQQLGDISKQLNFLTEQICLMNQRSFGRKTEKASDTNQLSLFDSAEALNEAEAASDQSPEPVIDSVTISSYTRKKKTKRETALKGLPARVFEHTLPEEELAKRFPDGYKELPAEIYKRLSVIPQTFFVDEHHVHVYASKSNDGTIIKAQRPADVFRNSIATPSLLAMIISAKYAQHIPLDRQARVMKESGVRLESNTLANWMIKACDHHLFSIYDALHAHLYDNDVIHADETPFEVIRDGRSAGSKSYMWVYRNGACNNTHPVILFDYQKTRRADHPREFLKDFSGVVVTDGYQVYHKLEKERKELKIAGCWVHAKRGFSELIKASGTKKLDATVATQAANRISELFHLDSDLKDLSKKEREQVRQRLLKPKVDDFFSWAKSVLPKLPPEGKTAKSIQYCLNQEPYLRVFLSDGNVPMSNNHAEQAIRPFTIGRKNWVIINSPRGASASAILYSLTETAKANHLRPYSYFEYLLSELPKHAQDTDRKFIADLLPWSESVQKNCRVQGKS